MNLKLKAPESEAQMRPKQDQKGHRIEFDQVQKLIWYQVVPESLVMALTKLCPNPKELIL